MSKLHEIRQYLKKLRNRIIPVNRLERDVFYNDIAYDNFTRQIFIGLSYFVFEFWIYITSYSKPSPNRGMLMFLMLVHLSAIMLGGLYRSGKLKINGSVDQIIITIYSIIIVFRGLQVSLGNLTRGGNITPLILALTITSAFFYRRFLSTLFVNISAFVWFSYSLMSIEWPPGPGGPGAVQVQTLFDGRAIKYFNDVMLMTLISCFLAIIIVELRLKVFRENVELKGMSKLDSMTKLLNHINIYDALAIEAERAVSSEVPLTIVMIDIDYFKKVNDNYGHVFGDKVILGISEILKDHTRDSDYVGRYGGEEFMLILTDTDIKKAQILSERIRSVVESNDFNGISVTVSLGLSQYDILENTTTTVEKADKALYRAKSNGRNRVEVYT